MSGPAPDYVADDRAKLRAFELAAFLANLSPSNIARIRDKSRALLGFDVFGVIETLHSGIDDAGLLKTLFADLQLAVLARTERETLLRVDERGEVQYVSTAGEPVAVSTKALMAALINWKDAGGSVWEVTHQIASLAENAAELVVHRRMQKP
jgi:hypothetical protein